MTSYIKKSINKVHVGAARKPTPYAVIWLVYFSFLLVPLVLYALRFLDDNRLVSWYWSISLQQLLVMFTAMSVVLVFAVVLSRIKIPCQQNISIITLLSFLMLIPFWTLPESIIDNARYFSQAKYVSLYGIAYYVTNWGESIFAWTDLPLIPLLYGVAFKLFGETRTVIQVMSSLFFSGTVLVTYLIGKRLWSESHGLLAAIFLLGVPYLYSQVPLMLVDIPAMFFVTLAVYMTILAVNRDNLAITAAAALAIILAMLSKYSAWLFLSVIPFVLLSNDRLLWSKSIKQFSLLVGLVLVFFGVVFVYKYDVFIQQFHILFNYQLTALNGWKESNVSTFLFQVHPFVAIAALLSVPLAMKNRDKKYLVIGWMLMLVFLLEIERVRYLMIVFPMLALMAAYMVATLRSRKIRHFIGYGVALSSYVMALVIGQSFLRTTSANNIKLAGEYLNTTDVKTVNVIVLPQLRSIVNPELSIPALDYHTNKRIVYKQLERPGQRVVPENAHISPVKFSWDYTMPAYYTGVSGDHENNSAIALVYSHSRQLNSSELEITLSGYRLVKEFKSYSNIFKYKTLVNLYLPV